MNQYLFDKWHDDRLNHYYNEKDEDIESEDEHEIEAEDEEE